MAREKTLEDRNRTVLGLIALGVVTVLIAAMLLINAMGLGYKDYTAQFSQGGALRPGDQITIAGIQVGRVTSMKLAGDHVAVEVAADDARSGGSIFTEGALLHEAVRLGARHRGLVERIEASHLLIRRVLRIGDG